MNAIKYRISTVADFAKVPANKRAECLEEFSVWLSMVAAPDEFNAKLGELLDVPAGLVSLCTDSFVWIDDGKHGISEVTIVGRDGVEVLP